MYVKLLPYFCIMILTAIIEDVSVIRESITQYLNNQEDFKVLASCTSVEEFMALPEEEYTFDVILTDIGLPGMSGIEGIRLFKERYPRAEIIMLTVFQDAEHIFKSLCAGATGYLLKSTPLSLVRDSIINITKGEVPMSKAVARKVLEYFNPKNVESENGITQKEMQVIQSLVEGLSYKLIADRLDIGIETVRYHIKNIYRKLHVNSKAQVIRLASQGKI